MELMYVESLFKFTDNTFSMISYKNEYHAILTSFLRLCIVKTAISNNTKLRQIIVKNKLQSIIVLSIVASIAICRVLFLIL